MRLYEEQRSRDGRAEAGPPQQHTRCRVPRKSARERVRVPAACEGGDATRGMEQARPSVNNHRTAGARNQIARASAGRRNAGPRDEISGPYYHVNDADDG